MNLLFILSETLVPLVLSVLGRPHSDLLEPFLMNVHVPIRVKKLKGNVTSDCQL